MSNKLSPQKQKHLGHNQSVVTGSWGPHRAKIICNDCGGKFVAWCLRPDHTPKSPNSAPKKSQRSPMPHKQKSSVKAKFQSIIRHMNNPNLLQFKHYKGPGTIIDQSGNIIYITQTGKKFRLKSYIDWACYDSQDLANALETGTVDGYYEQQLRDPRSDPNVWRDKSEEMCMKSYYAARAGRASLI